MWRERAQRSGWYPPGGEYPEGSLEPEPIKVRERVAYAMGNADPHDFGPCYNSSVPSSSVDLGGTISSGYALPTGSLSLADSMASENKAPASINVVIM